MLAESSLGRSSRGTDEVYFPKGAKSGRLKYKVGRDCKLACEGKYCKPLTLISVLYLPVTVLSRANNRNY